MSVLDFKYDSLKYVKLEIKTNLQKVTNFVDIYDLYYEASSINFSQTNNLVKINNKQVKLLEQAEITKVFLITYLFENYFILCDEQNEKVFIESQEDYEIYPSYGYDGSTYQVSIKGKVVYLAGTKLLIKDNDNYTLINIGTFQIVYDKDRWLVKDKNIVKFENYQYFNGILFNDNNTIIFNAIMEKLIKYPFNSTAKKSLPDLQIIQFNDKKVEIDVNLFESKLFREMIDNEGYIHLPVDSDVLTNPYKGLEFLDYAMITNSSIYEQYYVMLAYFELFVRFFNKN